MGVMEYSPTTIAPLILRNTAISVFSYADKSLLNLSEKYKLLEVIRYAVATSFVFFLRLLPSLFPSLHPEPVDDYTSFNIKPLQNDTSICGIGDSGIARALSQLLSIVNDIPVSSRKYEIVRSLAERLLEENHKEDVVALHEVNRTVLSAAFSRTFRRLEAVMVEDGVGHDDMGSRPIQYGLNRVLRVVRSVGNGVWSKGGKGEDGLSRSGNSAEKLAAELLWLAQKLTACGFPENAVEKWASASKLAALSLWAEPQLQGSLVKFSAFMFKQAKDMGLEGEETEEGNKENHGQIKLKMLTSWLPLLCRASNGTDSPVLSISERAELEKLLEETIDMLEPEEQEQVLSLWLHHFTYTPSSDWPNLHASYARWCNTSRKLFISKDAN